MAVLVEHAEVLEIGVELLQAVHHKVYLYFISDSGIGA